MRLLVMSDLHLEFAPFDVPLGLKFDAAIFAGDIWRPLANSLTWLSQLRSSVLQGRPVILVPGNHEFYRAELSSARRDGREIADRLGIHLLDPGTITVNGVRFVGATLWSDFNLLGNPIRAKKAALRGMNDYRRIKFERDGRGRHFNPVDSELLHRQDVAFIEQAIGEAFDGPTVVVTHHAPHPGSVMPQFVGDELSPAFASDLTELITKYCPDLWVHGHDHGQHDYLVGRTRILANPAGYPTRGGRRENPLFDPRLIIEI